ncbi:unnamed protein product [Hydatigera taeniaeformis]|uniref:Rab-GAP TBC domain-containing protein n=1 Tax=Hydatigena taeniaeformis TaxID=6205 RepID=A0A0R3WKF6_HYDTA|nr:unnamed protein product [Hydatigera taeniaeformis]
MNRSKEIAISDDFDEITALMQEIESEIVPAMSQLSQTEVSNFLFNIFKKKAQSQLVPHCFSSYLAGKLPARGTLFLSINYISFLPSVSNIETQFSVPWIKVVYRFIVASRVDETFCIIQRLADLGARRLLDNDAYTALERDPIRFSSSGSILSSHHLLSRLDTYSRSEAYRKQFHLPTSEILYCEASCLLCTPFNKAEIAGRIYLSENFLCFRNSGNTYLLLVVPLSEVISVDVHISQVNPEYSDIIISNKDTVFVFVKVYDEEGFIDRLKYVVCDSSTVFDSGPEEVIMAEEALWSLNESNPPHSSASRIAAPLKALSQPNGANAENQQNSVTGNESSDIKTEVSTTDHHSARFIDYFPLDDTSTSQMEQSRNAAWERYFSIYGKGRSMYVVDELEELVLKGLPQNLRGHLWMLLSGAENDVDCAA